MTEIYQWFAGLATLSGFLYFLAGFAAAHILYLIRCKIEHRSMKISWCHSGIAVGVATIVIISLQTQVAYNTAKHTAENARSCQIEFAEALSARSQITTENDDISQEQRKIVFNWIHNLAFPPEPWASMEGGDPRREHYNMIRTAEAEKAFQASLDQQDELQKRRAESALPDPTCGKDDPERP